MGLECKRREHRSRPKKKSAKSWKKANFMGGPEKVRKGGKRGGSENLQRGPGTANRFKAKGVVNSKREEQSIS